jgi:hypothetical protein
MFVQACDECQRAVGKEKFFSMPLHPVIPKFPFSKWGLDFIGPINPPFVGHVFILTATDILHKVG